MCFPEIHLKKAPIALAFFLQTGTEKKGFENESRKTDGQSIRGTTVAIEMDHPDANSHLNRRRQPIGWTDFRDSHSDSEELVVVRSLEEAHIGKNARAPGVPSVEKPEKAGTGTDTVAVDRGRRVLRQFSSAVKWSGPAQFSEKVPPVCLSWLGQGRHCDQEQSGNTQRSEHVAPHTHFYRDGIYCGFVSLPLVAGKMVSIVPLRFNAGSFKLTTLFLAVP